MYFYNCFFYCARTEKGCICIRVSIPEQWTCACVFVVELQFAQSRDAPGIAFRWMNMTKDEQRSHCLSWVIISGIGKDNLNSNICPVSWAAAMWCGWGTLRIVRHLHEYNHILPRIPTTHTFIYLYSLMPYCNKALREGHSRFVACIRPSTTG